MFSYIYSVQSHSKSCRYKTQKSITPSNTTPCPENAAIASDTDFASLAGIYKNDSYGLFELCLISPERSSASVASLALASNVTILPGAIGPGIPMLLALLDRPWFSYIKIKHFNKTSRITPPACHPCHRITGHRHHLCSRHLSRNSSWHTSYSNRPPRRLHRTSAKRNGYVLLL